MKKMIMIVILAIIPCTSSAVIYDLNFGPAYPIGGLGDDFTRGLRIGTNFFFWSPGVFGLTLGGSFGFSRFGAEDRDDIDSGRTYIIEFLPSIRYYPVNSGILQFFLQGGLGYYARDTRLRGDFDNVDETEANFGAALGGGMSVAIGGGRRIILLPMLNFASDSSFFSINLGLLLNTASENGNGNDNGNNDSFLMRKRF